MLPRLYHSRQKDTASAGVFFMRCLKPYHSQKDDMYYPCGRCFTCKIQRREDWTLRMLHELEFWPCAMFVTLTYDDEHLPDNGNLSPDDLSHFFKRLRRNIDYQLGKGHEIKYFACGEYGPKTHRPHYHAIIFGLDYANKEHCALIKASWNKCAPWMWKPRFQHGRIRRAIAPVVVQSIRYVAGYVFKKAVDNSIDNWIGYMKRYKNVDIYPVFQRQSNGIGKRYALKHSDMIRKRASCFNRPVPRYYRKVLGITEKTNEAFKNICIRQREHYSDFVKLDSVQRKQLALPKTFVYPPKNYRKALNDAYDAVNDMSISFPLRMQFAKFIRNVSQSLVFYTNLDYDEQRLHTYSRRYNK